MSDPSPPSPHVHRLHGIDLLVDRPVAGWPLTDSPPSNKAWRVDVDLGNTDLAGRIPLQAGPVAWEWNDRPDHSLTTLTIRGGTTVPSAAWFRMDWNEHRLECVHSMAEGLEGCLDLLSRWFVPDIARRQAGALPLHATGLRHGTSCFLLGGASGHGKSTLTGALLHQGATLVSDEPACVQLRQGTPLLSTGVPVLRINPDSLASVGVPQGLVLDPQPDAAGKRVLRIPVAVAREWPVRAIVLLAPRHGGGEPLRLRRLGGSEALQALMEERYSRPAHPDRVRADFAAAAALVGRVPVLEASVADDFGRLPRAATRLLEELLR
jgi:hypothetical protein